MDRRPPGARDRHPAGRECVECEDRAGRRAQGHVPAEPNVDPGDPGKVRDRECSGAGLRRRHSRRSPGAPERIPVDVDDGQDHVPRRKGNAGVEPRYAFGDRHGASAARDDAEHGSAEVDHVTSEGGAGAPDEGPNPGTLSNRPPTTIAVSAAAREYRRRWRRRSSAWKRADGLGVAGTVGSTTVILSDEAADASSSSAARRRLRARTTATAAAAIRPAVTTPRTAQSSPGVNPKSPGHAPEVNWTDSTTSAPWIETDPDGWAATQPASARTEKG